MVLFDKREEEKKTIIMHVEGAKEETKETKIVGNLKKEMGKIIGKYQIL